MQWTASFQDRLPSSSTAQQQELKLRHLYIPATLKLLKDIDQYNTGTTAGCSSLRES